MINVTPILLVVGLLLVLVGVGSYLQPMSNFFDYTSEGGGRRAMISSLFILHIILLVVVFAEYRGHGSNTLYQIYDKTLDAIVWNLGIITADKGASLFLDAWARIRGTPIDRAAENITKPATTETTT